MANHPVYTKLAAEVTRGNSCPYVDVADLAKLIRSALKKAFPGAKFSVTSERFSMGSAVRIHWEDGPQREAVEAITNNYEGVSFDGSIDMAHNNSVWLYPDGTASRGKSSGTANSRGYVQPYADEPQKAGAISVGPGSYITTSRDVTEKRIDALEDGELVSVTFIDFR